MIKLIHGDCLDLMKEIHDGSVDLILTDPPYGTTSCKWDSVIPFEPMWEQLNRIIKPNGVIVLFGSEPFSSLLRCSNLKNYKYDLVWKKPKGTGHLNAKKMPLNDFELISLFYTNPITYNPQFSEGAPYKRLKCSKDSLNKGCYGKTKESYDTISSGKRYPKRVLEYQSDSQRFGSLHPTQKPIDLLEYLIQTYSNKNELVLDFTMGSGSTGIACINTDRGFIGIEKDDSYFQIAKNRIYDTLNQDI